MNHFHVIRNLCSKGTAERISALVWFIRSNLCRYRRHEKSVTVKAEEGDVLDSASVRIYGTGLHLLHIGYIYRKVKGDIAVHINCWRKNFPLTGNCQSHNPGKCKCYIFLHRLHNLVFFTFLYL